MTARRHVVSPLWLLCWLLLGLPRVGLAAGDAPRAEPVARLNGPAAGDGEKPASETSWGRPERDRTPLGLRLLSEVGAGVVTSMGGVLAGGMFGALLCGTTGLGRNLSVGFITCDGAALGGALVGLVGGYGLGVWWGGEAVGGDGGLLFTLLGTAVGGAMTGLLMAGGISREGKSAWVLPLPILLGSHLGYALSQRSTAPLKALSLRPGIQPMLTVSAHGVQLGLGGQL